MGTEDSRHRRRLARARRCRSCGDVVMSVLAFVFVSLGISVFRPIFAGGHNVTTGSREVTAARPAGRGTYRPAQSAR